MEKSVNSRRRKLIVPPPDHQPDQLVMIACERQPGNLRISSRACALRFLLAQNEASNKRNSEFEAIKMLGLRPCRECPTGRLNANG
ncbi:hypothetical protein EG832_18025 [bacterium]|nr:hypothetical protein [bacterium]